jgi:hypothetical protein
LHARRHLGAFVVLAFGWELLGLALPAEYLVDFTLPFVLGIAFSVLLDRARARPRRDRRPARRAEGRHALARRVEIGLVGWMAFMQLVLFTQPHLTPKHAARWMLMQFGMVLGFVTAYPVNGWLVRRGLKETT